jgi:hypothetical protein
MKLRNIAVTAAVLLAVGCANKGPGPVSLVDNPLEQQPDIKAQEVAFLEEHGTIGLEFDENNGEWISVESTGTSPITFNHANSREEAMTAAAMRARANLVEFLNNTIKTEKFVENVSKTILNDSLTNGTNTVTQPYTETDIFGDETTELKPTDHINNIEQRNRSTKVAQQVKQTLHESTNGILKGAMIINRSVDPSVNMVAVKVRVSKKSINVAHKIRAQMEGQ